MEKRVHEVHDLMAGYAAYTDAADFGAAVGQAPATTPSILSIIAASTAACGAAVSAISAASVGETYYAGC